jgi:hypothetical protein
VNAREIISGETVIFDVMGGMGTLWGRRRRRVLPPAVFSRMFYVLRVLPDPRPHHLTTMVIFVPHGLLGFWSRALNQ